MNADTAYTVNLIQKGLTLFDTATPLAAKIEGYFVRLLEGPGAARRLLQAELA